MNYFAYPSPAYASAWSSAMTPSPFMASAMSSFTAPSPFFASAWSAASTPSPLAFGGVPFMGDQLSMSPLAQQTMMNPQMMMMLQLAGVIMMLQSQLNQQMYMGDMMAAANTMAQLQALTAGLNIPPHMAMPHYPMNGNVPFARGDAPYWHHPGGCQCPTKGFHNNTAPIPSTVPGGGNQGVVNTGLDICRRGYPYVWGGDGPQEGGYDCSGFTKAVYARNGINIPRTAQTQYDHCRNQGTLFTDRQNLKPGDLIFFNNPYSKKTTPVGHVMVYLGDGKMMGAQSGGVKVYDYSSYWQRHTVGYGRPR